MPSVGFVDSLTRALFRDREIKFRDVEVECEAFFQMRVPTFVVRHNADSDADMYEQVERYVEHELQKQFMEQFREWHKAVRARVTITAKDGSKDYEHFNGREWLRDYRTTLGAEPNAQAKAP